MVPLSWFYRNSVSKEVELLKVSTEIRSLHSPRARETSLGR